jgi:hypothetical protein
MWIGFIGQVARSCEHGDEPSGSIKCGEFLDYLSVHLASQEGLCSMELVSYHFGVGGVNNYEPVLILRLLVELRVFSDINFNCRGTEAQPT